MLPLPEEAAQDRGHSHPDHLLQRFEEVSLFSITLPILKEQCKLFVPPHPANHKAVIPACCSSHVSRTVTLHPASFRLLRKAAWYGEHLHQSMQSCLFSLSSRENCIYRVFKAKASPLVQPAHLGTTLHVAGGICPALVAALGFDFPKPNGTGWLHWSCCCSEMTCPSVHPCSTGLSCLRNSRLHPDLNHSMSDQVCVAVDEGTCWRESPGAQLCPGWSLPPKPSIPFPSFPLSEMGWIFNLRLGKYPD